MSDVYSFRSGPTYRGASRQEMFDAAMEQPLSLTSTLMDQAKGGVLESFGLGTAIRDFTTPEEAPSGQRLKIATDAEGYGTGYRLETPEELTKARSDVGALSEDQYKASASFREGVPYDPGMTEQRAAALAAMNDAKQVRDFYAQKRPFAAFIGNIGGQALDPINYVPIAGPLVKAASVGRFGRIAGEALTAAADAASNTAVFGIGTAGERAKFGDDVSWQSTVSQIATAALIGGAFGTIFGAVGKRVDARLRTEAETRIGTLRTVQESRIALNEGIDALVRGEDVRLSPNSTEPMARVAGDIQSIPPKADGFEPPVSEGFVRIYHSGSVGEGETGRWVSTNRKYAADYRSDLPLHYLDIPADDPRINNADIPEQGVKEGFTFNFETTPQEAALLKEVSRDAPQVVDQISVGSGKQDIYGADIVPNSASTFPRAGGERVQFPVKGRMVEGNIFQNISGGYALVRADDGKLYRSTWAAMADAPVKSKAPVAIDTTSARQDPAPEGIKQAEAAIAKPDDSKALAAQYRVDPETGAFHEEGEVAQLASEGRLTEGDALVLAQAQADFETGSAYADALKSVANCLI